MGLLDDLESGSFEGGFDKQNNLFDQDINYVTDYVASGDTLTQKDLLDYKNLQPIKDYMIKRKGVQYKEKDDQTIVDDFVEHMRFFNANTVSTAGELRFVQKGDTQTKALAKNAYAVYDQLGNVFQNDGFFGAVKGVGQYMEAMLKDPTNYLGLVTGGTARAAAGGLSITGKQAIKSAVRKAGKEALKSPATAATAKKFANDTAVTATQRFIMAGASSKASSNVFQNVAEQAFKEGRRSLAKTAMKDAQQELFKQGSKKALRRTIALDSAFAVLQDVQAQNVMLEVGAQEEFSKMRAGFSAALGGIGGGLQIAGGKLKGISGLDQAISPLDRTKAQVLRKNSPSIKKGESKKLVSSIEKSIDSWTAKVTRGTGMTKSAMPSQLFTDLLFGSDRKSGIIQALKESEIDMRGRTVSDAITNAMIMIPEDDIIRLNKKIEAYAGFTLGDIAMDSTKLSDIFAKTISEAGTILGTMGQFGKLKNSALLSVNDSMIEKLTTPASKKAIEAEKKAMRTDRIGYAQSIWKRLLVSSPATTALNVAGFSQFYIGQSLADVFNATALSAKGLGQAGMFNVTGAKESFKQSRMLIDLQAQKMRNLLDPFTTHDTYMQFLESNSEVKQTLFETLTGGIEVNAERFNINPDSKIFKGLEAVTKGSNAITGVRIQDSFTKSQMFMGELDKAVRKKYGVTLREVLQEGDEALLDENILGKAMGTTMESVFSADYTTEATPKLLRQAAKIVEDVSRTPGLGTIIPFGRFFNNVVAFSYKWSPAGFISAAGPTRKLVANMFKKDKELGIESELSEVVSRATVGTTFLYMMAANDDERREKGLAYYELEGDGGTIIDAKNTFPLSAYLAMGRMWNMKMNGETIPRELITEAGAQLAVGQLAKDTQFSNDLINIIDAFGNSGGERGVDLKAFGKATGNIVAGLARPLDAVNRVVGYIADNDTAKDIRQADTGMDTFTQAASKYFDNIIEVFADKTDSITGETLKIATREGDVYDPNPFARIFGVNVKQGRTATEQVYSMAEMHPWQASERTKMPEYDRMLNNMIAPVLEKRTQMLLNSDKFKKGNLNKKRIMLKTMVTDVKAGVRKDVKTGVIGIQGERISLAKKAMSMASREIREEAMKFFRDRYGVEADIEDMSYAELDLYIEYIKLIQSNYKV
jgi:hypothetical protein